MPHPHPAPDAPPQTPPAKKVDESWKQEARRDKETARKTASDRPAHGSLPKPDFSFLVNSLAMQALFSLGQIPHPATGKPVFDLDHAKHGIDLLDMLSAKTKGNLSDDEAKLLSSTLYDLRTRYIAASDPGLSAR